MTAYTVYMIPPLSGQNNPISFNGRTYYTASINLPIAVQNADVPQLETLGWRRTQNALAPVAMPLATVNPLLQCANRGQIPNTVQNVTAANLMSVESRKSMWLGNANISELRLSYSNFYILTNSGLETVASSGSNNAVTPVNLFVALEVYNPVTQTWATKQVTWSNACQTNQGPYGSTSLNGATGSTLNVGSAAGASASTTAWAAAATNCRGLNNGIVLQPGATDVVCDPVYPWQFGMQYFPANMQFYVRETRVVSTTQAFASFTSNVAYARHSSSNEIVNGVSVEGSWYADPTVDTTSQLLSTGVLTNPGGGINTALSFGPSAVVGRAIGTPDLAILIIGDSLLDGTGDWFTTTFGDTPVVTPSKIPWTASTAILVGNYLNASGKVYQYTVAGTTGSTAPTATTSGITDGTATCNYIGTASPASGATPCGSGNLNAGFAIRATCLSRPSIPYTGAAWVWNPNVVPTNSPNAYAAIGFTPVTKITIGGSGVQAVYNVHSLRRYYWKYHTHVISDYGSNDIVGVPGTAESATTVFNQLMILFNSMKSGDSNIRHIAHISLINRCSTTDQGQTTTNQTSVATFGTNNSVQLALNTYLNSIDGQGVLDEYIDITGPTSDSIKTSAWPATVSIDCVHPYGNTIQSALAGILAARISNWS